MFDMEDISENIGGIGGDLQATKKGKLCALMKQHDGTELERLSIL